MFNCNRPLYTIFSAKHALFSILFYIHFQYFPVLNVLFADSCSAAVLCVISATGITDDDDVDKVTVTMDDTGWFADWHFTEICYILPSEKYVAVKNIRESWKMLSVEYMQNKTTTMYNSLTRKISYDSSLSSQSLG